jgi:hypothetical protein
MLKINTRYVRVSPKKDESIIKINTEEELQYHQDLETKGFQYKEVVIHKAPEVCTACEG